MAEIEEIGLEEYYADFVSVTGERGHILIFGSTADERVRELADDLGAVLDGAIPSAKEET